MAIAKLKEFGGMQRLAPAAIEAHETEQALRDATFAHEMQMLDLKNEFVHREAKLRTEFLERVAAITSGE